MCGIAGFWTAGDGPADGERVIRGMTGAVDYRGPDDDGHWLDPEAGVALGHRRLSILDLSPEGHQPMASESGRFVMVFNGEVYNFAEIRAELEGHSFRGHSDTEVMLAAIEEWGLDAAVRRFVGMFAFGLWDRRERSLHLVRDRLGIKPLYYGWTDDTFMFGSELKSFHAVPGFGARVDPNALALYLRHNYIPAPYSVYEGVRKLTPGSVLSLPYAFPRDIPTPKAFWSAREVAEQGAATPLDLSDAEATASLDSLLREAVRMRMLADVPLGAFLSGGVDSSTVVALMQAQSSRPVKTFTIGFREKGYNEAEYAAQVARHLGTDHTELYVSADEAMEVVPSLPRMFDEPFSDSSQIPTYLVSALARRSVTVSLSGDGGDELFAGYERYAMARNIWRRIGPLPRPARRALGTALGLLSPGAWDALLKRVGARLDVGVRPGQAGDRIHKLRALLDVGSREDLYRRLVSHEKDPQSVLLSGEEPPTVFSPGASLPAVGDFTRQMQYLDLVTYLPDDILTKVDRASMAVSLEARVPLLDHRVVEFSCRVPMSQKVRGGKTKWLLREVLNAYVPRELMERPKMGFGVPMGTWLRGPLRDWAEELLSERRLVDQGYFKPGPIRRRWLEHVSGERNWQSYLWDVLMFQAWVDANRTLAGAAAPR